ncbi:winged helix-turn-helix domain-containing protein [Halomonas sp. E14]|uniref:winged helix-turn-helix domain-containing protein n=1 Tax=Halomonas sp. E14 TaxID=3397245 RepID=UPI00403E402A
MSQAILAYLQRAEDGVTIAEISLATGLTGEAVWFALGEMARAGWVIGCARANRPPLFHAIVRLGPCDWCGLVDHHLVAGMCPSCMVRSTGLNLLPTGPLPIRLAPIPGVGPVTPQTEGATP